MGEFYQQGGQYRTGEVLHKFTVEVLSYFDEKEKIFYALSLSLDLVGVGETEKDALVSFNDMLEDFVKYTCNKNTIATELLRLGWDVENKGKVAFSAKSPSIEDLKSNPDWVDIWAKNPKIGSRLVEFAL